MVSKIRKRDGAIVPFDQEKITVAIKKAFWATHTTDYGVVEKLSSDVSLVLDKKFKNEIPSVEDVQDTVEEVLLNYNYLEVLRAYILYREEHKEIREEAFYPELREEPRLTLNALKVLQRRYLLRDDEGRIIETPRQLFSRVAKAIAYEDKKYRQNHQKTEKEFYDALIRLEFLPNTPTLMNAGADSTLGLAACYVLPVEDSLINIFDTLEKAALIHQGGGGTGFNFSHLRPKGDIVKSTKGVASGPVSFMRIFDITTDVIKQGGKRRGANMGILNVNHPDILEFIISKQNEQNLKNFNISVALTDEFMHLASKDRELPLLNPRTKKIVRRVKARQLFDLIIRNAWQTGDPGVIFIDEINRHNQLKKIQKIEATNPCGEQPLLPYESCVLGSINLSKMTKDGAVDWEKLRKTVRLGVHFLDNTIDANKFPIKEIESLSKSNRRIGLGVMGWAEMLIQLGIRYNSEAALILADKIMRFVQNESIKSSIDLAKKRGSFPNFKKSEWVNKCKILRNVALTTIAPTGTISLIAGCSSGIEPLFAVSFIREVMEKTRLLEINPEFEKVSRESGFYSKKLMHQIARSGSIQKIKKLPEPVRRLFITALDIAPEWHVKMQAAFQKHVDNAVSKTINLPKNATVEDVRRAYLLAYKLKCKGITVYRYGSKKEQVLYIEPYKEVRASSEFSGGCAYGECMF